MGDAVRRGPHRFLGNTCPSLASIQDRLEEAIAVQEETLRVLAQHDDVSLNLQAFAYNNVGYVLIAADRYAASVEPLRAAVALTEETDAVGPYARSLTNLAAAHQVLGQLDEARALHERALAAKRRWFEPGHAEIGFSLNNLAGVVRKQSDYDYAILLLEEPLDNFTNALGAGHVNVAIVRGNLAATYQEAGRNGEAIVAFATALADVEAAEGPESSNTLPILLGLGDAYEASGDGALAAEHLQRAVRTGTAVNPDGWHTALALSQLAALPDADLDLAARDAAFERSLEVVTRIGGPAHPDRAEVLVRYARHLDDTGRADSAAPLFSDALDIEEARRGEGDAGYLALLAEYRSRFAAEPAP